MTRGRKHSKKNQNKTKRQGFETQLIQITWKAHPMS